MKSKWGEKRVRRSAEKEDRDADLAEIRLEKDKTPNRDNRRVVQISTKIKETERKRRIKQKKTKKMVY